MSAALGKSQLSAWFGLVLFLIWLVFMFSFVRSDRWVVPRAAARWAAMEPQAAMSTPAAARAAAPSRRRFTLMALLTRFRSLRGSGCDKPGFDVLVAS